MGIILEAVVSPAVSAMTQDNIPVIRNLTVGNDSDETIEDIKIVIRPEPSFSTVKMINVRTVGAHEKIRIKNADLVPINSFLSELKERIAGSITISVEKDDKKFVEKNYGISVLTASEWYGTSFPEMTSSFVTPDDPHILRITANAAKLLETWTGNAAMDRYASSDRGRVRKEVGAIYGAMQQFDIRGTAMQPDWRKGCKISSAERMIDRNIGTQFDLTLLMLSCAESVGMNTVIIFTKKNVAAGIWLDDTTFPDTIQNDIAAVTKHVRDGSLMLVDCEGVTSNKRMDIEASETSAKRSLFNESEFVFAMDIKCSRGNAKPAPAKPKTVAVPKKDVPVIKKGDDAPAKAAPEAARAVNELTKREQWEKKLLDLSFSNELLNMRMNDTLLPIMTNNLAALKEALSGNSLKVMGRPAEWDSYILNEAPFEVSKYVGRHEVLIEQEFRNRTLRSPYNDKEVDRRLLNMHRISKKDAENCENSLYIILGILKWHDDDGRVIYAPLVMVPAETVTSENDIRIRVRGDDPVINRTLLEKLRRTRAVDIEIESLPTDKTGVDTERLFASIKNSIRTMDGGDIIEGAFIGIFRPERFDIWNDLRGRSNALFTNKLTKSLMEGKLSWTPEPIGDAQKQMMLVYEADSSQRRIIKAAGDGRTFVMRSPPGTGSLRTVCNIVSDSIYNKRTVLIVSEKDIILKSLKEHLDDAGIGKFCFRLHSGIADKKKMLDQFRSIIDNASSSYVPEYATKKDDIERMYNEIGSPVRSLYRRTNVGMNLIEIIQHYDKIKNKKAEDIEFPDGLVSRMDPRSIDKWTVLVNDLIASARSLGHPSEHPLSHTGISEYGRGTKEKIIETANEWIDAADETEEAAKTMLSSAGLSGRVLDLNGLASTLLSLSDIPEDVIESESVSETNDKIRELLASVRRSFDLLNKLRKELDISYADDHIASLGSLHERMASAFGALDSVDIPDVRKDDIEQYLAAVLDAKEQMVSSAALLRDLRVHWKDTAIRLDTKELQKKWNEVGSKKLFSGAAKKAFVKELADHLKDPAVQFDTLSDLIGKVDSYVSAADRLKGSLASLDVLDGGSYSPIRNDCDSLERTYDIIDSRLESLRRYGNPDAICKKFNETTEKNASRYLSAERELLQRRWSVASFLVTDITKAAESDDIDGWRKLRSKWINNIDKFEEIAKWNRCRKELAEEGIGCVADAYAKGMKHDSVLPSFTVSIYRYLRDAYASLDPSLASFDSNAFDNNAKAFRDASEEFIYISRAELSATASSRVNELYETSAEMNTLRNTIATGGRVATIRKVLENAKEIFNVVAPCMLMSPPAVSKYLNHDVMFDVVIVDASQMPSYRVIDVMTRGKAAVIIGDNEQIPPMIGDSDTDGIMDDCLSVGIPRCDPEWNYRPDGLVDIAAMRTYGPMRTFPPAKKEIKNVIATYVNGRYERTLRTNAAEAEAAAKELIRVVKEKRNVGLITFSDGQKDMILEAISKESIAYPQISSLLDTDNGPFVKHVNDAQGHERDVIILSLGVGKDAAGKLTNDLAPFSRPNGKRRLNTALMCAKREIMIFSSLRPGDIGITHETPEGVRMLKELLDDIEVPVPKKRDKANELCAQISKAITEKGFTVHNNVGNPGATIDIAIVDPGHANRYIMGLLLDSGPFMNSDATDTEFVLRNMLERAGWSLMRVWTSDWLHDSNEELNRIVRAVEERAKDKERWSPKPQTARKFNVKTVTREQPRTPGTRPRVRKAYSKADIDEKTMSLEALFSNSSKKMIERDIRKVIDAESPVADTVVAQRLGDAYGMKNRKLSDHVISMISNMDVYSTMTPWNTKILWKNAGDVSSYDSYRIPSEKGERRIKEVESEEIINAITDIASKDPNVSSEGVIAAAAEIFDERGLTDEARYIITTCIGIARERKLISLNG